MKYDMYELFSQYKGRLPEIEERPCDVKRIKQLALQGIAKKEKNIRPRFRVMIIGIAAAVAAMTGITAVANTDAFARFMSILHRTEPGPVINSELPLMSDDDTNGMEENISEEKIFFSGSDSMEVSTAGMYYDNNTLMLSVEMKLKTDVDIPEDSLVIPHYVLRKNETETELSAQSGIAGSAVLIKGDEPNSYYATFYLTAQDMAGSTLEVRLENIIAPDQPWIIQKKGIEEEDKWREEYGADEMSIEEWKQLWQEKDLDRRSRDFTNKCLDECEKVIEGSWTAQISIPTDTSKTITAEKDGFKITADTLSITLESSGDIQLSGAVVPVITMKDKTVIFETGTSETQWLAENGVCASPDDHEDFAYRWSNIYSYSRPYPTENIADITVYVFGYENGAICAESYVIYESEGEN